MKRPEHREPERRVAADGAASPGGVPARREAGPSAGATTVVRVRVRYAETDAMGVAYHGAYLPWLELARTAWLREHALSYRALEASGTHLPVVELSCRYRSACRYDDGLRVEAVARRHRRSGIAFAYRVVRERDDRLIATAATRHAAVERNGRIRPLPEPVLAALARVGGPPASIPSE